MKTLLILNPVAGKGRGGKLRSHIEQFIAENSVDCNINPTAERGHATRIAQKEFSDYERIIVSGGDGTLNEVINGIDLDSDLLIGLLPIGSGNDFAKALKLPDSLEENLKLAFNENSRTMKADIGQVSVFSNKDELIKSSRFTNSCGIGFDAYVAYLNQTNKVFSGLASYIIAVIKALWEHNSVNIEATFDDRKYTGEKLFICIGNGETAGGGLYLTPGAVLDDGYLNYTIVESISRLKLLRYLPLAVINRLTGIKYVEMNKFKEAHIMLKEPFYVHNDGEIVTDSATIIKIESLNSKLKFIVP
jgi:YegS/Rv2252/BmrU family lipid kinase